MSARTSFNIPDDLLRRVKELAEKQGRTVTDIVNAYLSEYVKGDIDTLEKKVQKLENAIEQIRSEMQK